MTPPASRWWKCSISNKKAVVDLIGLHLIAQAAQNRCMRASHGWQWLLVCLAFAIGAHPAEGEDISYAQPLTQVSFDRLVPTSYPVIRPKFAGLQSTTYPLIDPGVPHVHITEGLTQSFARPLLVTSETPESILAATTTTRRVTLQRPDRTPVQQSSVTAVITSPSGPGSTLPLKRKENRRPSESGLLANCQSVRHICRHVHPLPSGRNTPRSVAENLFRSQFRKGSGETTAASTMSLTADGDRGRRHGDCFYKACRAGFHFLLPPSWF